MRKTHAPKLHVEEVWHAQTGKPCPLPMAGSNISAGFPSPADDYMERTMDLNEHLVRHPSATFFVRVSGDSMLDAGIHHGDLLVVDRSVEPVEGKVVIAVMNGELVVKRLSKRNGKMYLVAENTGYPAIEVHGELDFLIWGVVTHVIHEP